MDELLLAILALALFIAGAIMAFVGRAAGLVAWATLAVALGGVALFFNEVL